MEDTLKRIHKSLNFEGMKTMQSLIGNLRKAQLEIYYLNTVRSSTRPLMMIPPNVFEPGIDPYLHFAKTMLEFGRKIGIIDKTIYTQKMS
jgi:hypothetical protein